MTKKNKNTLLIIFTIIFYAIWATFELVVKDILNNSIQNDVLCQLVKSGIIKNLVWTLPAILLIHKFKSDVYITLKEMFSAKVNWLEYIPIFAILTVYVLVGSILNNGKLEIVSDFGIDKIIIVLFVGLTEEVVFRGWLLNATICEDKKWFYIIINAVLFLSIHFPTWIHTGVFINSFTSLQFLEVIALSVIFSYTFIKSRNILIPITLHMYYDLLVFMFI